jgi:protein TonB
MFEDALLDSSPRQRSVLRPIHYLLSAFAGTLFFVLGLYLIPLLFVPAGQRALMIAAAIVGVVAALYAVMLCYVGADARQQQIRAWPWVGITLALNLPGFLLYLVYSAQKTGDWRRAAIPLAYAAELMFVGAMILVPLIYTQALPRTLLTTETHIAPSLGRPPVPTPEHPTGAPPRHAAVDPFTAPPEIPPIIADIHDTPGPPQIADPGGTQVIGVPEGFGRNESVIGSVPWGTAPPPPPVVHATPKPRLVRLSAPIVAAKAIYQPKPVYPHLAIISRIQGTVVLQAIIGKDGTIQELKVQGGHPMLVNAALDAVKTWRYQPTLLNSEPVDVLTEIDVIFSLGE